jgi:hypothetical protein
MFFLSWHVLGVPSMFGMGIGERHKNWDVSQKLVTGGPENQSTLYNHVKWGNKWLFGVPQFSEALNWFLRKPGQFTVIQMIS